MQDHYDMFEDMEGNEILLDRTTTYEVMQTLVDYDGNGQLVFTHRVRIEPHFFDVELAASQLTKEGVEEAMKGVEPEYALSDRVVEDGDEET